MFLALTAFALGLPVLRRELFNPLANAHAELARKNRELERSTGSRASFWRRQPRAAHAAELESTAILEMMLAEVYGPLNETQRDRSRRLFAMAASLLTLINDVLDLNQIERGRLRLDLQRVEIPPLLDAVLDVCTPLAAQKGLRFVRDYADAPALLADEVRVREIFTNVLANACKFTERGTITVRPPRPARWSASKSRIPGWASPPTVSRGLREFQQIAGQGGAGEGTGAGDGDSPSGLSSCTAAISGWTACPAKAQPSSSRFRRAATRRRAQRPGDRRGWRDASYA